MDYVIKLLSKHQSWRKFIGRHTISTLNLQAAITNTPLLMPKAKALRPLALERRTSIYQGGILLGLVFLYSLLKFSSLQYDLVHSQFPFSNVEKEKEIILLINQILSES